MGLSRFRCYNSKWFEVKSGSSPGRSSLPFRPASVDVQYRLSEEDNLVRLADMDSGDSKRGVVTDKEHLMLVIDSDDALDGEDDEEEVEVCKVYIVVSIIV